MKKIIIFIVVVIFTTYEYLIFTKIDRIGLHWWKWLNSIIAEYKVVLEYCEELKMLIHGILQG